MTFARGLKPSDPSRIMHRLAAARHPELAKVLAGTLSGNVTLQPCAIMDQGQTSTCHAHSAAAAIWCAYNAAGKPLPYTPSPLVIASNTYADLRTTAGWSGAMPALADNGAQLQDDADAIRGWGVAPMGAPIGGRYSDVPEGSPFPEPDLSSIEMGGEAIVSGEYSIAVDSSATSLVVASLNAKIPVWLGTLVGDAFERLTADGIAQPTPASDKTAGGHAMYISGVRTNATGGLEFRVTNSWGSGWADGGGVWASEAWLLACWDLWPMAVTT